MQIEKFEDSINYTELLPQLAERIFAVCRTDPMFHKNNELDKLEKELKRIHIKLNKQKRLLEKSYELKEGLNLRLQSIIDDNEGKQTELLEKIGD